MSFVHSDLGHLSGSEIVEVSLANAANVRLMDATNFAAYRRGDRHRYVGGYINRSPYRMAVPGAGHWHVAIDLGGRSGSVRAGIRVLG